MKEKRSYERVRLEGSVNFKIRKGASCVFKGDLLNISHNGFAMSVTKNINIEADKTIEFELITPNSRQPLIGDAKVRYVIKSEKYKAPFFRVGAEFVNVNRDMVLLLLKRHQVKIANEIRSKAKVKPLDFMPY